MSFTPNPNLHAELNRRLQDLLAVAAVEGAAQLHDNLSSTQGTGVQYPLLPNRSSAPDEYPTRQSGALQRGVGVEAGPGITSLVVVKDERGKLLGLEFSPPSENPNREGSPSRHSGGRAMVWRTMSDAETHARMLDAMRGAP